MGYWEDVQNLAQRRRSGQSGGQTRFTSSAAQRWSPGQRTTNVRQQQRGGTPSETFYPEALSLWQTRAEPGTPMGMNRINQYTTAAMAGMRPGAQQPPPGYPPGGPAGGGRGGGGGGGGGGGLTQSAAEMIARLLGQRPQGMTASQVDLPDYQATPMAAFDPSMFDLLSQRIGAAGEADKAAAAQAYGGLQNTLSQNYVNPYMNVNPTATPAIQSAMRRLVGGQGAAQQDVNAENAYAQNSDMAFANLIASLGMGNQASQQSRMAQVAMDANTAQQGIGADVRGMQTGVDVNRLGAQREWQQRADERAREDAMLAQQWARDEAMQNWQAQQQANQYNSQLYNQWGGDRTKSLIELIQAMAASGLDPNSINGLVGV